MEWIGPVVSMLLCVAAVSVSVRWVRALVRAL